VDDLTLSVTYTQIPTHVCAPTHTYIVKIIDVSKLYYKLNNID